jgi:penicillin amidase
MNTISLHPKKILKFLFLLLILFILGISGWSFWVLKSSVPKISGKLEIRGLRFDVEVVRDTFGIPHIKAKNTEDAYRVLGYIMASERLFQMEMQRRMANGELSEILGERTLGIDKLFRTLGVARQSEQMIAHKKSTHQFDPQMIKEADAFFDGVNQFQAQGPLPFEFRLLRIKPRPFSLKDAESFIGVMGYSFGMATLQDPLLSKLHQKLGGELIEPLRTGGPVGQKSHERYVYQDAVLPKIKDLFEGMGDAFPLFDGSNGWVMSGKRSESGFPILANDPHIAYSHPGVWFEAHIVTPEFENYGHYLAIVPFAVIGHNREKGWGFTMSLTDDIDLYKEDIDWNKKTYRFKDQVVALSMRSEKIKVKSALDLNLPIAETQHGPILNNGILGENLAIKWSYLDDWKNSTDLVTVLYKMGRARTMEEFKLALSDGKAPGLNVLYADKKNIGWWMFGDVVIRNNKTRSDFILDGASGENEPVRHLSFEEKPHLENPPEGLIVSANSRPANFPKDQWGDFQPDYRRATIHQILTQKEKWNLEDLKVVQSLSMNFENKKVLAKLIELIGPNPKWKEEKTSELFLEVKNWDLVSMEKSRPPLLFYTWTGILTRIILDKLSDDEFASFIKLSAGSDFLNRTLFDEDSPWLRGRHKKMLVMWAFEKTIKDLEKRIGNNQEKWTWGSLHQLEFSHPLGKLRPLNLIFNHGPYPMNGAIQEVNNQKFNGTNFNIVAGPSTRRLIDFAHPEKALGILPSGNSGHIFSPFYKDQTPLFIQDKYRPMSLNESDYKEQEDQTLIFYSL